MSTVSLSLLATTCGDSRLQFVPFCSCANLITLLYLRLSQVPRYQIHNLDLFDHIPDHLDHVLDHIHIQGSGGS